MITIDPFSSCFSSCYVLNSKIRKCLILALIAFSFIICDFLLQLKNKIDLSSLLFFPRDSNQAQMCKNGNRLKELLFYLSTLLWLICKVYFKLIWHIDADIYIYILFIIIKIPKVFLCFTSTTNLISIILIAKIYHDCLVISYICWLAQKLSIDCLLYFINSNII